MNPLQWLWWRIVRNVQWRTAAARAARAPTPDFDADVQFLVESGYSRKDAEFLRRHGVGDRTRHRAVRAERESFIKPSLR